MMLGLIGLGLVGSSLVDRFKAAGFEVIGYDIDSSKIDDGVTRGMVRGDSVRHVAECVRRPFITPHKSIPGRKCPSTSATGC